MTTDNEDVTERLERLESLVEAQRQRIDELEADRRPPEPERRGVSRRTALKAGGLAGLLALGSGVAGADPQGQVGTQTDPVATLYAEELAGGITGDEHVSSLLGGPLQIDGGELSLALGPGLTVTNGKLGVIPELEPPDVDDIFAGMDQDDDGAYLITNVHELQAMNAGLDADYRLGNDIPASSTALWNDGGGFEPIGALSAPFHGSLVGDGYAIDGLTVDRAGEDQVGLFGAVAGANIDGVGLVAATVTGSNDVGVLAGNVSTVSTLTASYASGSATGSSHVGGLVGVVNLTDLDACFASTSVSGDEEVGGLIGFCNNSSVDASYATGDSSGGDQVGGFIGSAGSANITECYATGAVTGTADLGGLVGTFGNGGDSYWDVPASGQQGSAVGTGLGTIGANPPAAEMVGDAAATNMAGFDFDNTWSTVTGPDDYPVLQAIDENAQLEARG